MIKKYILCVLTSFILLTAQITIAAEKQVECEITSGNEAIFKGKCLFIPERSGTFYLSALDKNKPLFDEVLVLSVTIIKKDTAEVRGLTIRGNNSRWGEAKRSMKDKACWTGSDFNICAR